MYCEKFSMGKKEINKPEITVETFNRAIRTYQREDVSYLLAHGILKQVPEDEKLHPVISRKTSKKNVYIGSAIACALVLPIIVGFAYEKIICCSFINHQPSIDRLWCIQYTGNRK